ncbi:MAG: 7TM-DISM domain-containing protein, partial [Leptospiraceae bacterium]|nr:7TM-DISM domain-containing protein [Leptospiraceae bacterium]
LLLNARLPYHWLGPGQILTESSYYRTLHFRSAFYAAIFSAIALLILYQTALVIYTRSRAYLFYLLSAVSYFTYQIGFTGYAVQLNLVSPLQNHYIVLGLLAWGGFFLLFLGELFQGIRKNAWILGLTRLMGVLFVAYTISHAAVHPTTATSLQESSAYLMVLTMTAFVLLGLIRRGIVGLVVFFAFAGVFVGVAVLGLTNQSIIPLNLLTRHAPLIGSTVEMTVLAVLMGVVLRNVQSSRLRSNAEEKLGKDVEQKANQYARQLQTEILDRAALDLRLPVESIQNAVQSAKDSEELNGHGGQLLHHLQEAGARLARAIQQDSPVDRPRDRQLCLALERVAAELPAGTVQIFENTVPPESEDTLVIEDWQRLVEQLKDWASHGRGLLAFRIEENQGGSRPDLLVSYGPELLSAEGRHFAGEAEASEAQGIRHDQKGPVRIPPGERKVIEDNYNATDAGDAEILRLKVKAPMRSRKDPNLTDPKHSGRSNTEFLCLSGPSSFARALLGSPPWQDLNTPPASLRQAAMYFLDLSDLRIEQKETIPRLKSWMDELAEEQPTLILLADRRIRPEDLELDPDLDTVLYRPVRPEQVLEEWTRTASLAKRLGSQRKDFDLTRQRSEARLRRSLEKALGKQLGELRDLAAGPESGTRQKDISERIRTANESLRKILNSLPD